MKLVNATYFIEKTGYHQSWVRKILSERLENYGFVNRFRLYKKEDMDDLIEEYILAREPKNQNEWDIHDIKSHFKISTSYAQNLVNCNGFPHPCRRMTGVKPSNRKRLWLDKEVKKISLYDYSDCWRIAKNKEKTKIMPGKMLDIEKQFLRGFRL